MIFYCNNCDANRAFVTIRESTATAPSSSVTARETSFFISFRIARRNTTLR